MAISGQTVIAIIPARGGSKRVPGKNLRAFRGKPLIQWTLDAVQGSKYVDRYMASTDSLEIFEAFQAAGCPVMNRPAELATDTASSEDVMRYCIRDIPCEWIVLLQLTSPLRLAEDIDACLERAAGSEVNNGCISVGLDWKTNGAVYVARRSWLEKHDFSHDGMLKYRMPEERCLDINEEADFEK